MEVRFWGTRGSLPTPGPQTVRFGGNTVCVEVRTGAGHVFIFDCGTGARPLGDALTAQAPVSASILFSHTHWDHIQGFPFFTPAFDPRNTIALYGPQGGRSLHETLARQMELSYFPVALNQLPATLSYTDLGEGAHTVGGARIVAQYLNHPAVTLGYRVEADGAAVVYACDHEPFGGALWRSDTATGRLESILHEGDRRHARFLARGRARAPRRDRLRGARPDRGRRPRHAPPHAGGDRERRLRPHRSGERARGPRADQAGDARPCDPRFRHARARRPGRAARAPRGPGDGDPPGSAGHLAGRRGQHARRLRGRRDRLPDEAVLEPAAQRAGPRLPRACLEALTPARRPQSEPWVPSMRSAASRAGWPGATPSRRAVAFTKLTTPSCQVLSGSPIRAVIAPTAAAATPAASRTGRPFTPEPSRATPPSLKMTPRGRTTSRRGTLTLPPCEPAQRTSWRLS